MKKKRSEPAYFAPALDKGLDILEALSMEPVPQTLADLARLCGRSRNELFRMVDALEKRSYIARDPISGAYQLTLKLYQLAHTHSPVDQLLKAAYFPMRDLANSLHESCHLCILKGDQLLVIAGSESPAPVRLSVEIGHTAPPLTTVSGRLLIAMLDEPSQRLVLERDPTFSKLNAKQQKRVLSDSIKIRKDGFHIAPSLDRMGMDVSCIIGSPDLGITAALGVPFIAGSRNHGKEQNLIPVIQEHAWRITQTLGLQPLNPLKII